MMDKKYIMDFLVLLILSLLSLSAGFEISQLRLSSYYIRASIKKVSCPLYVSSSERRATNEDQDYDDNNNNNNNNYKNHPIIKVHNHVFVRKAEDDNDNNHSTSKRFVTSMFQRKCSPLLQHPIEFQYQYKELIVTPSNNISPEDNRKIRITLLVQPIGVGIGGWYYDRLLEQFQSNQFQEEDCTNIYLVPDLLACGGTASSVMISSSSQNGGNTTSSRNNNTKSSSKTVVLKKIPCLTVADWSQQLLEFMSMYEKKVFLEESTTAVEWCLISNGGCIPIPLEIAKQYVQNPTILQGNITNLILSATPRIGSLIKPQDTKKVQKSYKLLSGVTGKLFWWYSLRNNGAFIQKFSEKNLVSKPENLGPEWLPTCVQTAKKSRITRFSTFAFLAGSLNGGNQERFDALRGVVDRLPIDVITGRDKRSNPAKSWFWTRSQKVDTKPPKQHDSIKNHNQTSNKENLDQTATTEITSLVTYLKDNGFSGREMLVKGRRCPAYEDAVGYAEAVRNLLKDTP